MPIRPHLRGFYPIDWKQLSAVIRFERAKGRCEGCGRPHGATVQHLGNGTWLDEARGHWRDGQGRALPRFTPAENQSVRSTKVALATAHLDHDPSSNNARNLKALCQRCHILNDKDEHRRQRWLTYRKRKAIGDFFLGLYRETDFRCAERALPQEGTGLQIPANSGSRITALMLSGPWPGGDYACPRPLAQRSSRLSVCSF